MTATEKLWALAKQYLEALLAEEHSIWETYIDYDEAEALVREAQEYWYGRMDEILEQIYELNEEEE